MNWIRRLFRFPARIEPMAYNPHEDVELVETRQRLALVRLAAAEAARRKAGA